jgi:tetratricopeptide (TPR) repeat protein
MATRKSKSLKASCEVNTLPEPIGPLRRRLIAYYNDYHDAVELGDRAAMLELDELIPPVLAEFERTESWEAENPLWLQAKTRAGWYYAKGHYGQALEADLESWKHAEAEADRPETRAAIARRKAVSAANIADELHRLGGRSAEAVEWARRAVQLDPSNSINHMVLAMALYHDGQRDAAGPIIAELRRLANFRNGRDVLANCLLYERDLHEMEDLPAVRLLLRDMAGARGIH